MTRMNFHTNCFIFLVSIFLSSGSTSIADIDQCLIGNDLYRTRLFCPSYDGNDKVFCCGELDKR